MKSGFLKHFRKKRHTLHLCACAFALRKAVIQLQLVQGHFWGCAISGGIYIYIQKGIKQHGFPHNNQTHLFCICICCNAMLDHWMFYLDLLLISIEMIFSPLNKALELLVKDVSTVFHQTNIFRRAVHTLTVL